MTADELEPGVFLNGAFDAAGSLSVLPLLGGFSRDDTTLGSGSCEAAGDADSVRSHLTSARRLTLRRDALTSFITWTITSSSPTSKSTQLQLHNMAMCDISSSCRMLDAASPKGVRVRFLPGEVVRSSFSCVTPLCVCVCVCESPLSGQSYTQGDYHSYSYNPSTPQVSLSCDSLRGVRLLS
ncbi:hypothetical protein J6590_034061 [Homalodisca vitripennis]|nr:hypothetical protein J6590_034061 [Homalodisca vitripennis]